MSRLQKTVGIYCSIISMNWFNQFSQATLMSSDIIEFQSKLSMASQAPSQFAYEYRQILRPLFLNLCFPNFLLIVATTP